MNVVREEEREWNYKEQKWEIKEAAKYEGEADDQGSFTANIDLREADNDLAKEDNERYQDLHYNAYITDPSTGRTEERQFDLRVTKQPIHVYVILQGFQQNWDRPVSFYVSTSYADGPLLSVTWRFTDGSSPTTMQRRSTPGI
ncbi:MAG: hypothetical protein ACLQOO_10750 [Terriglobia bacterium]